MNPLVKNTLAVIAGLVVGSVVNMGLITISGQIIPPPAGADVTTMEGLTASMHLFEPKHFLFPFLAHALGTLTGAAVTARLAARHHRRLAMVIGLVFLAGGIINVFLLPSPLWFSITDLALAYIPMGYLGGRLVAGTQQG